MQNLIILKDKSNFLNGEKTYVIHGNQQWEEKKSMKKELEITSIVLGILMKHKKGPIH